MSTRWLALILCLAPACAPEVDTGVGAQPNGGTDDAGNNGGTDDGGGNVGQKDLGGKPKGDGGVRTGDGGNPGNCANPLDLVGCACNTPGATRACYTGPASTE